MTTHLSLDAWLALASGSHHKTWDLGLDRVSQVAERLDLLPPAPRLLLVAGTNGKGSTIAALERLSMGAGFRTGTTTSPHLIRFNERIIVNGQQASDEELASAFAEVEKTRGEISLTYFEYASLVAFLVFRRRQVEVALVEIGLGGRLDAMNIVEPDLSLITNVSLDHMDYLGDSVEQIGLEKAHVFRAGKPALFGAPEVPDTVERHASTIGADFCLFGRDFGLLGDQVWFNDRQGTWRYPLPGDLGVPAETAALAIAAWHKAGFERPGGNPGLRLKGLALPGRQQLVTKGKRTLLLDVAHNPASARLLAECIAGWRRGHPGAKVRLLFGILGDKDIASVVAHLRPLVDDWFCVGLDGSRGITADRLARFVRPSPVAGTCATVASALSAMLNSTPDQDLIVVTGSFVTVGEAMQYLGLETTRNSQFSHE